MTSKEQLLMLEPNLLKKKGFAYGDSGAVMAMDFEGSTWKDSVNTARTYGVLQSADVGMTTNRKINGTQSFFQNQAPSSPSGSLYTARTAELNFAGDFWFETWVFCNGQGNGTFTGGNNVFLAFGNYTVAGGLMFWGMNGLNPIFNVPDGGTSSRTLIRGTATGTNGAWQHHAVGRKDGKVYLFLGGKMVGAATEIYNTAIGFGTNMYIGNYYDNRNGGPGYSGVNGNMDRLRLYNKCLTTSDFSPLTNSY